MATEAQNPPPPVIAQKTTAPHPFAPLTADEITSSAHLARSTWPQGTDLNFKTITLLEPPKAEVIPLLELEAAGKSFNALPRKAFVTYYLRNTDKFHEAVINLSEQKVESTSRLGPNIHGSYDGEELLRFEEIALNDPKVKAEIAKLKLPEGTVFVSDPWIYGADGINDDRRMAQAYIYARDPSNPSEVDSNHYAFPIPVSPVIDTATGEVIRVELLPTGAGMEPSDLKPMKVHPPNEYLPEMQKLRTDVKPLMVVQPEGASFTATQQGTSTVIEWQKWTFRVGFNQREGMVLYNVRYDGRLLFYRMALSDMNIPYADPRHPYHKKSAFDLGDVGAGVMCNNLQLGCDCLGSIHYLSATLTDGKGEPTPMENCVCIHEQDGGINWKHMNYRTGRAVLARNRELVVQSIITVGNYEYIMAFYFNQAAEMHYEVRATGILSTQPIDEGVEVDWGTIVHPGVLAAYHQHIFSLRIDPAIDGHSNRFVKSEIVPMPRDAKTNPHGTGYTAKDTVLEQSGGFDLDWSVNRSYKIQNAASRNPVNGKPVAYKIQAPSFQPMVSDEQSFNHRRAEFADHAIYAVKYREDELYAGGKYTNQSRGGTGVRSWANRREGIVDEDLVVFVQFGMNHIPRIEDFPVMPAEIIRVAFKPVNFFTRNPALDVPPSEQGVNKSVLVNGRGQCCDGANGATNGATNGHLNGVNGSH